MANGSTALVRRQDRAQEVMDRERRVELVTEWHFGGEHLSARAIRERLAGLNPPILVDRSTVCRDIARGRERLRREFSSRGFDPVSTVGSLAQTLQHVIGRSLADANQARDGKERGLHRRIAADAVRDLFAMYGRCGLIQPRDFAVPVEDDGRKAERIPSHDELQRYFEGVVVHPDELRSESEIAWLYGDVTGDESDGESDGEP